MMSAILGLDTCILIFAEKPILSSTTIPLLLDKYIKIINNKPPQLKKVANRESLDMV